MATCQSETVNSVPQVPDPEKTRPEHSLSFAKWSRADEGWNLWAKRTTSNWWLSEVEGQMRAITVLGLEIEGKPSERAAMLGRIFARIARDQFGRRRSFIEIDAIAHFWGLIGELAAAYTTADRLGFAAKAVCHGAAWCLATDNEQTAALASRRKARVRTAKRGAAERRKSVRS
jgi:hypothetical protein